MDGETNRSIHGDWETLSIEQYRDVDSIKKQLRKGNWKYIREHPEIRAIIRVILHQLINKKPKNIYEFTAKFFDLNNNHMLIFMINSQLKLVNQFLRKNDYGEYDGETLFGVSESSHSFASKSTLLESANSLLSYSCIVRDRESKESVKECDRDSRRSDRLIRRSERRSRASEKDRESRKSDMERDSRKSDMERDSRKVYMEGDSRKLEK